MGGTLATLNVLLKLQDELSKGLQKPTSALQKFAKMATSIGKTWSLAVTAPIVGFLTKSVMAASDLSETINKTTVVFGPASQAVLDWSKDSAQALGMSREQALAAASGYGNLFTTMGMAPQLSADMSRGLVQNAADLASFNNASPDETLEALRSGLIGQYEPLRRFGIVLSEATVKERALAMGLAATEEQLTPAMLAQARYALILEQSANAQGDFAETSNGLANQQRILRAQLADVAAALGAILLPLVLKGVAFFNRLLKRFQELSPEMQKWIVIILGVVAAIGPLLIVLGHLAMAISALGPAIALMLGPLGLVIAAVAFFALAYAKNWFGIRDITNEVVGKVVGLIKTLVKYFAIVVDDGDHLNDFLVDLPKPLRGIVKAVGNVVAHIQKFVEAFRDLRRHGIDPVSAAFMALRNVFTQGTDEMNRAVRIINAVEAAVRFAIRIFGELVDMGRRMVEAFGVNGISGVLAILATKLNEAFGPAVTGVVIRAIQNMIDIVSQLVEITKTTIQLIGALISGDWARAWELFGDLVVQFVQFAIDAMLLFPRHLLEIFRAIDWGAVGSLLLAGFLLALDFLADVGGRAWTFIKGQFDAINWGELISNAGDALWNLGGELLGGLWTGITWVWDNIVKPWLSDLASKAKALIPTLSDALFEQGQDLIRGLKNGLVSIWTEVTDWIAEIPGKAQTAAGDLAQTLWEQGQDLIRGLKNGLVAIWANVTDWLSEIPGKAQTAVGDLITTLLQQGKDLLQGLWDGIQSVWDSVRIWLGGLGGRATTTVGALITTLLQKGKDLLQGLWDGIQEVWSNVRTWLGGIGGRASSVVGGLGGVLWGAGKSLMQGLKDGIAWGWNNIVAPFLSTISSLIPDWKGPKERDLRLLYGPGQWVMEGFRRGIESQVPFLRSDLASITGMVGGFGGVGSPSFAMPSGSSLGGAVGPSVVFQPGAIVIQAAPGDDGRDLADKFYDEVMRRFSRDIGLREGF